ncbi:signal peptidase I [Rosistilla oblonga]|uniref:signal peptidase I n=1 Tax=Rosistilla oblonga TaxID=2527990 RepID=UPI003A985EB5
MNAALSKKKRSARDSETADAKPNQSFRETVESIVVAIILALLFRAFVAEAFVIPTGSMAPTLMGTHKDIYCPHCGENYRTGASLELPDRNTGMVVVGTICPNCRSETPLDLEGNPNDATFSGDRILVSKFSYAFGKPERFDVGVFKNPGNAKQNYIKRIVGLPNETVRITNGDLYIRPDGSQDFKIARKQQLSKLLSMSHLVHDSAHQAKELLDARWPLRWQPWDEGATSPPENSWKTRADTGGMTAKIDAGQSETRWLRYYHDWPGTDAWDKARNGIKLDNARPYRVLPITDFYAYNGYLTVPRWKVYDEQGQFLSSYRSGQSLSQFGDVQQGAYSRMGAHWVGDLLMEIDIETEPGEGALDLMLVRAGVEYRCTIDLTSGDATLKIVDGDKQHPFDPPAGQASDDPAALQSPVGQTTARAGDRIDIRFSNYDDELRLWIDGDEVLFDRPTTYDSRSYRTREEDRPYWTAENPLDGAPLAIGVSGVAATLNHVRVLRDKYYIALPKQSRYGSAFNDYSSDHGVANDPRSVGRILGNPEDWGTTKLWAARRSQEYTMDEGQYFPLGDNSPESADARGWTGKHFVPRDLLVGKAVFVFWPHPWNTPVPFTPNFRRMKLIH